MLSYEKTSGKRIIGDREKHETEKVSLTEITCVQPYEYCGSYYWRLPHCRIVKALLMHSHCRYYYFAVTVITLRTPIVE